MATHQCVVLCAFDDHSRSSVGVISALSQRRRQLRWRGFAVRGGGAITEVRYGKGHQYGGIEEGEGGFQRGSWALLVIGRPLGARSVFKCEIKRETETVRQLKAKL